MRLDWGKMPILYQPALLTPKLWFPKSLAPGVLPVFVFFFFFPRENNHGSSCHPLWGHWGFHFFLRSAKSRPHHSFTQHLSSKICYCCFIHFVLVSLFFWKKFPYSHFNKVRKENREKCMYLSHHVWFTPLSLPPILL